MAYTLRSVNEMSPELFRSVTTEARFITHAHNPSVVNVLQASFGWKGGAFLIMDDEIVTGYFICMIIRGRIVSMPHFSFGGILTKNDDLSKLYSNILPLVLGYFSGKRTESVSYLLREIQRGDKWSDGTKVVSWLDLVGKSPDQAVPLHQKNKIRKAKEKGLTCISGSIDLLDDFFSVYSRNVLRLGSPVLPKHFFAEILQKYRNGNALIFCVYYNTKPIGASFLMSYMGFFENTWFSTLSQHNWLFPGQLLHSEMIEFALKHEGHTYSFGRSSAGSGVHEFKRRWGTQETIVYWNYDSPVKINLRKAGFVTKIWKHFPLPFANFLGPGMAKWIY